MDLDAIARWLASDGASTRAVRAYIGRIRSRYGRIGLAPLGGGVREEFGRAVRSVPFERTATIYYRVEADRVLILRILRRGRDVSRPFTP